MKDNIYGNWKIHKQFIVEWEFDEAAQTLNVADVDDEQAFMTAAKNWLFEKPDLSKLAELDPTKGCELVIKADGTFAEIIDAGIPKDEYNNNHNGIALDSRLHKGKVYFDSSTNEAYLLPEKCGSEWTSPEDPAELNKLYYDVDMPVSDRAYLDSGRLIRVLSTVTDAAYLTRRVFIYT